MAQIYSDVREIENDFQRYQQFVSDVRRGINDALDICNPPDGCKYCEGVSEILEAILEKTKDL